MDVGREIIPCSGCREGGCSVHFSMNSSILGRDPVDTSSTPVPKLCPSEMSPDIAKYSLSGKT